MDKQQLGWGNIEEIAGDNGVKVMKEVQNFSPRFAKLALEFGYVDLYSDNTLDLKQRALITLSSLISQGEQGTDLTFHYRVALRAGVSKDEILELIIHCSGYAGFPKAMTALFIFKETYQKFKQENPGYMEE
ncbi:carboxymuconolactone decarboxylase family protein [Sediminibacillus halophilus]|uniref:4-carboxymuconolactone decarboxylase n=1 Tax=Sediminibacillus halophilus TaxID=482461 RepID=A0A1G9TAI0_9BACI|nr:carboxymuconolactone decarboxylase family protein [Sediminibacillus halophilus]SDM44664.1 4-carboxymuconolactone decarboxylase [Sediminibacillus halophilus]